MQQVIDRTFWNTNIHPHIIVTFFITLIWYRNHWYHSYVRYLLLWQPESRDPSNITAIFLSVNSWPRNAFLVIPAVTLSIYKSITTLYILHYFISSNVRTYTFIRKIDFSGVKRISAARVPVEIASGSLNNTTLSFWQTFTKSITLSWKFWVIMHFISHMIYYKS